MADDAARARRSAEQRRVRDDRLALDGAVWLTVGGVSLGGQDRIALLRAIAEQGSITQAAKAVRLSYKAAWDAVDAMNQRAGEALVERSAGGRGGGSTRLTAHGHWLVERFGRIDALHRRFIALLSDAATELHTDFTLLSTLNMKTSARNQFVGSICAVRAGAVNDEVELALDGGVRIVAIVTRESTQRLALRTGMSAFALVKASSVIVGTALQDARLSACNQLAGVVAAVAPGAVNAEVAIDIAGGVRIIAIVTRSSADRLALQPGLAATAIFDASDVILGVAA